MVNSTPSASFASTSPIKGEDKKQGSEAPSNNAITEAMAAERVHQVPLDKIEAANRIRQVDDAWAQIVADSFVEVDQLQPIDLMLRPDGQLVLIDGKHRLRAASLLGWEHIRAHIRDLDGETVRLRQIDANLIRRELNPLDRAAFLAARKDVYEALYPETKTALKAVREAKSMRP